MLFVYKLMIGSSKNSTENYPRKCFWTQEKETWVKFDPWLRANRPSNNWTLGPGCSIPSRENFSSPKMSSSSDELCQIRNSCGIPYFISSNILQISILYFKLPSVPMRDVSNDSAPPTINGKFTLSSQIHHYTTPDPLLLVIFLGNTLDPFTSHRLLFLKLPIWIVFKYG